MVQMFRKTNQAATNQIILELVAIANDVGWSPPGFLSSL